MAAIIRSSTEPIDVDSLVAREAPGLFDYFARRLRNADDAADLLGDTLVVVWRKHRAIPSDPTRARMWMYGVARRVLSTHRRSLSRQAALTERIRVDKVIAEQVVGHAEASAVEHLRLLIDDLDELDREIIGLVYWEGFSLQETATILSMRPGTVRSRHARARSSLRDALLASDDVADEM
jgi:RNA polymerase sigma-70 factor (ECF subfamily)